MDAERESDNCHASNTKTRNISSNPRKGSSRGD